MYKGFKIKPPFFELGPKAYLYGEASLKLALEADRIAQKYDVNIIYTPQYVDIPVIAREVKYINIFAQHMDPVVVGRGIGSVLPESLKAAGATGTLLNHAEKKMTLSGILKAIKRADEVGLATIVCADNLTEALSIAQMHPNIILAEPESQVGKQQNDISSRNYIKEINEKVKAIDPDIHILHSAGIYSGKDVYDIISIGAEATGCTSGVIKADDPVKVLEEMIFSLRKAWDERANKENLK